MALRNIVTVDTDRTSVLRKKTRIVEKFDERLKELATDMIETMHEANGVGLAAPQVGILRRMFVMNVDPEEGDLVIVNPEIIDPEGADVAYEGCLSVPQMYGQVKRPTRLKLKYQDLQGEVQEIEAEGLKARCICHETDHINGIMFTDKIIGELIHESKLIEDEAKRDPKSSEQDLKPDSVEIIEEN